MSTRFLRNFLTKIERPADKYFELISYFVRELTFDLAIYKTNRSRRTCFFPEFPKLMPRRP
jgi:hypothetical protein